MRLKLENVKSGECLLYGSYILNQSGERSIEKRGQSVMLKLAAVVLEPLLSRALSLAPASLQGHFKALAEVMGLEGQSALCRNSLSAAVVMCA